MTENVERWHGQRVLVTGVCGTVGRELLRQLIEREPKEVVGIDNNESELFLVREEHAHHPGLSFYLGDVRDYGAMVRHMEGVDVVLHTAGYKHVLLSEYSPRDSVQVNIIGVQNIIDAALATGVQRVIFTSSDKAVNPTSVMGTSKLMGERLLTAANALRRGPKPIFASTRFGNVLGSRGSVIPIFKRQIAAGGPVTLTDPGMTRFIMSLEEAGRSVRDAVFLATGGEVFVTKMAVCRIEDLARVMVEELAPKYGLSPDRVKILEVGARPGEKIYEELLSEEEVRRALELDQYFVVRPALEVHGATKELSYPGLVRQVVDRPYISRDESAMSREELWSYLRNNGLMETD